MQLTSTLLIAIIAIFSSFVFLVNVSADVVNHITCNGNACNNTYVKTTMTCPHGQYFNGTTCVDNDASSITPVWSNGHQHQYQQAGQQSTTSTNVCPYGYYFNGANCQTTQITQHTTQYVQQQQQHQQQICPMGTQWNGQICSSITHNNQYYPQRPCAKYCGSGRCNPYQRCGGQPIYRPQPPPLPQMPIYPQPTYPVYPIIPPIGILTGPPSPTPPILYPIPPMYVPQPTPPQPIRPPITLPIPDVPIVSPLPPQAIPPTFECDTEYTWNGYQCIKTITVEPQCPPEYNLSTGQCQHFTNGICPPFQTLTNGQCIGETTTNVQCPIEYLWNGEYCVHRIPSCPDGYNLANGLCEKLVAGYCPTGTIMSNGTCVYQTISNVQCPSGYSWNGNDCSRYIASCPHGYILSMDKCTKTLTTGPIITCPPGTNLIGHQCYDTEYHCPSGFYLQNNQCIQKIQCPLGYYLTNHQCTSICGEGYTFENNTCVQWQHQPIQLPPQPICPPNYVLHHNLCYPPGNGIHPGPEQTSSVIVGISDLPLVIESTTQAISLSPPPVIHDDRPTTTNPICPPGYHFRNHLCYRIKKIIAATCPDGYVYRNEQCESIDWIVPSTSPSPEPTEELPTEETPMNSSIRPQCPTGYNLFNNTCYPELTYYEDDIIQPICDEGYHFENGVCQLINPPPLPPPTEDGSISIDNYPEVDVPVEEIPKCLPDSYWYIDRCKKYLITTESPITPPVIVGPSDCFPGYHFTNGSCIPITPICPDDYVYYLNACYLKPTPRPDVTLTTTTDNTYWTAETIHDTLPINCTCGEDGLCSMGCTACDGAGGGIDISHGGGTEENCYPGRPVVQPSQTASYIDVGHNITNDITITNIVNNNNTIDQPINVFTNNTNNIKVYLTRHGGGGRQNGSGHQCSGGVTIIRNNETYHHEDNNCTNAIYDDSDNDTTDNENDLEDNDDNDDDDINNNIDRQPEKCCELISPRQCKRIGDEWSCFHRKYHRCGSFCTQPKVYLKPRYVQYNAPILTMPPPPPRYHRLMSYRSEKLGYTDCSGCVSGGYGCSNYCFNYDCDASNCNYLDQDQFCEQYGGDGCSTSIGTTSINNDGDNYDENSKLNE